MTKVPRKVGSSFPIKRRPLTENKTRTSALFPLEATDSTGFDSDQPQSTMTQLAVEHGLTPDEYQQILKILNRDPNLVELGMLSAVWSEHCSYKSSRAWIKTLPTKAPWVIYGPGENAGVIDIGDNQIVVFKMESHNHPSYIEPYQGAATGVGGILRDVFAMGARPVAILNALRFGSPGHPRTRHLVSGVVAGISSYGNCVGVPTVGGEINFHSSYNNNILVNVMAVGVVKSGRVYSSETFEIGSPIIYVGAKTGRDGIHGATMASAEFDNLSFEGKRPTVQVGDPFTEKLLIESCLELLDTTSVLAVQDMGAAGLTSALFEMVSKNGLGLDIDLDQVPQRETGMTSYEIMLSESQERMLVVLKQGHESLAQHVFSKWGLSCITIGYLTASSYMVVRHSGQIVVSLPLNEIITAVPEYHRRWVSVQKTEETARLNTSSIPARPWVEALRTLVTCPDIASRRWVYEQYDYMVMNSTVQRPGGDSAVIWLHGTSKGLALVTDCTPRYCIADPRAGACQAVAEVWRNLTAVGATPLAITDSLNFGNPEKENIMGQFVATIEGMSDACSALDFPVVSGNVSFYNETLGKSIPPTPVIGGVGIITNLDRMATVPFRKDGLIVLLIGDAITGCGGWLGRSLYLQEVLGQESGTPPELNLQIERRNGDFVRSLIHDGLVTTCHDIADGGLLIALTEMAIASGIGVSISVDSSQAYAQPLHAWLFGEDQGRYIIAVTEEISDIILRSAASRGVPARQIGITGGIYVSVNDSAKIEVAELKSLNEGWFPTYMMANDCPAKMRT